ncbi:hypothetical protein A6A19_05860 [Actinobacillus delphinicola]|uniref:DNA topoisomerase family protein n=1 Tax=Actinobacillus delphinicola TaxID=51161 RepID=UPI002442B3AB|nr:topoisomerase DNA-binding C4 zinc finger domain-containing protein [Actinobacillus delphinicola]MDG6897516.1 hypothetical protein [Actinobacillus delphinicola]
MTSLFSPHKQEEYCPKCGKVLQIKQSKRSLFLGCTGYPECDYLKPLRTASQFQIIHDLPEPCPKCGENLQLKQGTYGMFIGCSAYPDCDYVLHHQVQETPSEKYPCPLCQKGQLVLRRSRFGKSFYGCDQFPKCKMIINEKPVFQTCPDCHGQLALLKKITEHHRSFQCVNPHCEKTFDIPIESEKHE